MKALSEYNIQFVGLKLGAHYFEYELDQTFFEEFDCNEFEKAAFKVELEFIKQSTMMLLNFSFEGEITTLCDRCADDLEVEMEGEEKLIVKFGEETFEETDQILVIPETAYELNVAAYINEFIQLNLPQRRVHEEGECDEETLNKLNEINNNENDIDPRWSGLSNLKTEK